MAPGLQSVQRSCTPHVVLVLLGESDKAARVLRLPTLHKLQNLGNCVKNLPVHKADNRVTTITSFSGLILLVGDGYRQMQSYDLVHMCLSVVPEKCYMHQKLCQKLVCLIACEIKNRGFSGLDCCEIHTAPRIGWIESRKESQSTGQCG